VVDLDFLAYDQNGKLIITRTKRKIKLIMDIGILNNFEEVIFDVKIARMSELVTIGFSISHTFLDKAMEE
jgi:hypothetical protein